MGVYGRIRKALSLSLVLSLWALASQARVNSKLEQQHFDDITCREAVFGNLRSVKATREWSTAFREIDGSYRLLTPTEIIGVWVEARVFMNNEVLLRRITARYVETREFNLDSCTLRKVAKRERQFHDRAPGLPSFTDKDLRELLGLGKAGVRGSGVIYIWSPHMPLSYGSYGPDGINGLAELQRAAEELDLEVTVLMDPSASASQAERFLREQDETIELAHLRPAHAIELSLRGMSTHYPVMLVYSQGRLTRYPYPGRATYREYLLYIKEQLHDLSN